MFRLCSGGEETLDTFEHLVYCGFGVSGSLPRFDFEICVLELFPFRYINQTTLIFSLMNTWSGL